MRPEHRDGMMAAAREYQDEPVGYLFTKRERQVLELFFSNTDQKVFFMNRLPESVASALLAMYSRLKNPRGLRGHFVDHMVPLLMYAPRGFETHEWKEVQKSYRERGLKTLDAICDKDEYRQLDFKLFLESAARPDYWNRVADSPRIKDFLGMWLDTYGHNSIARTSKLILCVEDCSILTAKSLEWGRPGAGYIELSTRYVDFSGKCQYPIVPQLGVLAEGARRGTEIHLERSFQRYKDLMGDQNKFDGPFPTFLREHWAGAVAEKDLKSGVIGESCDVLGNLLPCATLTSVGIAVSGEALPELLKHLYLDETPENGALAEAIKVEAGKVGALHFIRHLEISEWRKADWDYLWPMPGQTDSLLPPRQQVEDFLNARFNRVRRYRNMSFEQIMEILADMHVSGRSPHDKLPAQFEHVSASFGGYMTFRGWRDLQRQGFCTHHRSLVSPRLGFYSYPKPAPDILEDTFERAFSEDTTMSRTMDEHDVPEMLQQYLMSMGEMVSYEIGGNLRQWEFCDWQRTKWGVNDEVRAQFLRFEGELRAMYPWWRWISRADMTEHYVFARGGEGVPLPDDN